MAGALLPLLALVAACSAALPVLPIVTAPPGTWPQGGAPACGRGYCGDVRAVLSLTAADIAADSATVQVFWRRRDPTPFNKTIIALDAAQAPLVVAQAAIESDCGVVTLTRPGLAPGTYYLYYLPFHQGSGGASVSFSWQGCNDTSAAEGNACVLGGSASASASVCAAVLPAAAAPVLRLENRDDFNAFTEMELLATPAEAAATAAALGAVNAWVGVFPEPRERAIRVLHIDTPGRPVIPVRWTPGQQGPQASAAPALGPLAAAPGEFFTFQLGLWAFRGAIANVSYTASAFAPAAGGGAAIPASALTVLNLEGSDVFGAPFVNTQYALAAGEVGSLWVGLALPAAAAPGLYTGSVTLASPSGGGAPIATAVTLNVTGAPVPYGGAAAVTSMARLAWLNSQRGLEDTVPAPFVAVGAAPAPPGQRGLALTSLNKQLAVGEDGLPSGLTVAYPRVRSGAPAPSLHAVLGAPIAFTLHDATPGTPPAGPPTLTAPAALLRVTNSSATWSATSTVPLAGGAAATLTTVGTLDFTSYLNFAVTISNAGAAPLALGDVRLTVPMAADNLGWVVGMDDTGKEACVYEDRAWRWHNTSGANKLWWGRPEAGLVLNLKGEGVQWDSPMFGKDYPVFPYIPDTWGGVGAQGAAASPYGVNLTAGTAVAFSGPRTLAPGESVVFRFDLALTPSKPQDWTRHWATRTRQLGYDVPYASPQAVSDMGVTVVTLHQGTPGIVNGSLINPWINYPFLQDTVPLLTNYTAQANALGVAVKYYYTIRELSARAAEIFPFYAMQGEILVDEDPWAVVQPGYAHDWNTHGGSAFLHQHFVSHYAACWQQTESNGEWDPSACSRGVSRLFNYYVEGLYWSFMQPPYINGIYYDGQNFPREGMIRIRRAADAAAVAAGKGFRPFLDLHTGREGTPDVCSYASHYPLVDYYWDGEGFNWNNAAPAYWLVETSLTVHGLTGDMLGSGERSVFRGMVFGMTQRDADSSQALWKFWDATRINETDALFSWWMADGGSPVVATPVAASAALPAAPAPPCTWSQTNGSYYGSVNDAGCFPQKEGPTPGCWTSPRTLQAFQAACCADVTCLGFSFNPQNANGCCKANLDGPFRLQGEQGFVKHGGPPPPPPQPCNSTLTTVWSKFGSHAVVAVAHWCTSSTNVTLAVDWAALGLTEGNSVVSLPDIAGVQAGQASVQIEGPWELPVNGGLLMYISAR